MVSKAAVHRNRNDNWESEGERILKDFAENSKKCVLSLHWDEKIMVDLDKKKAERLAILVSGHPVCTEGKLIHVSTLENGNGVTMADKIYDKLKELELDSHSFGSMVFDTTASNSGIHRGAATVLEAKLMSNEETKLLWFACRHHIPELILKAIYDYMFGATRSKDKEEMKEFKHEYWNEINKSEQMKVLPGLISEDSKPATFIQAKKEETISELTNLLTLSWL